MCQRRPADPTDPGDAADLSIPQGYSGVEGKNRKPCASYAARAPSPIFASCINSSELSQIIDASDEGTKFNRLLLLNTTKR